MYTIDLNSLMDEGEIEDALKSYCTDPTPERKLRVLSEIAHCIAGMTDAEIDITGTEHCITEPVDSNKNFDFQEDEAETDDFNFCR